jgi:hypothetical protein
MKNKMSDLRNHLFETIEALKDEEKPMDLARAKTISEVAQTIINSAKAETEFIVATGVKPSGSEFLQLTSPEAGATPGVTTHLLK